MVIWFKFIRTPDKGIIAIFQTTKQFFVDAIYTDTLSLKSKSIFIILTLSVYTIAFFPIYIAAGTSAAAFSILPVAILAFLSDAPKGFFIGFLAFGYNTLVLNLAGHTGWDIVLRGGIPGSIALILTGAGMGWLHQVIVRWKKTEQELSQQRLLLALEEARTENLKQFMRELSHDVKTPLSIINTSLYLISKVSDPEKQQIELAVVKQQTERLQKFFQDILTMSRLDHMPDLTLTELDINQILTDMMSQVMSMCEEKGLKVRFILIEGTLPILGEQEAMRRILLNLFENAINYTPKGETITIQTMSVKEQITIEIKDTGVGITESDLPHIFDPYYRADKSRRIETGGSGLGLAIVKRIVKQHAGDIRVTSKEREGTTFYLSFPRRMSAIP